MFNLLKKQRTEKITFTCDPSETGVIAEPVPAKAFMPDWFRKLPAADAAHTSINDSGLTVKRCMPFLDAMTTGWIIPLGATVRLEITDDGRTVNSGWDIDRVMVSYHGAHQVAGNPKEPRPACKFHNFWTITTPPGWSCLFVPPMNRPNPVFEIVAGVVDTDTYNSLIHFPFFAHALDGLYTLEKGTPIVQVIPFKRETTALEAVVRTETQDEARLRETIRRSTKSATGWYRKIARAPR